jgi:glutamine phosphoribosylpyrophosphate amidotransferase
MCAVIGAVLQNVTLSDLDLLESVFIESSIRGLHATGISFIRDGKLHTVVEPVSAEQFFRSKYLIQAMCNKNNDLFLIGHCRYSTSDLEYNQPISSEEVSIVHNGVVTQELHDNWKNLYGYDTVTKNDSELLLRTIEKGKIPLIEWQNASIASIELHKNKNMRFYRNGKRPLYMSMVDNGIIVTSTADVMQRASGGKISSQEAIKDCLYNYSDWSLSMEQLYTDSEDLQHV